MDKRTQTPFESSGDHKNPSMFKELLTMMKEHKKFWLIPIIVILLFFGILLVLGASSAAPFIYTLF